MVLNHWNSMAYAECLSSSMNNRKLSRNAEENSRCEADVTWSLSHEIQSLSKVLSLGCLRKWLQKSLLMQLLITNMPFFKYCTSACCWEKGKFLLAQREGSYGNSSKDVSKSLNFQFTCQHECICTFCYSTKHISLSPKKSKSESQQLLLMNLCIPCTCKDLLWCNVLR